MTQQSTGWNDVYEKIKKTVVVIQVVETIFIPKQKGKIVPSKHVLSQGSGFIYRGKGNTLGIITA